MSYSVAHQNLEPPQELIRQVIRQLRNHALWDSLLIFCPPLIATLYLLVFLNRATWMPPIAALWVGGVASGIGLLAVILRCRPRVPTVDTAARLLDEKAAAQDRFVTLATLDPSSRSGALFGRLQREATGLVSRVEIRRDFPYHVKRSFYRSAIASVALAGLLQLFLPLAQSSLSGVPAMRRIRELAQRMAQQPRLSELGRSMQTLATRLEDPKVSAQERQRLVQEMAKKIEQQLQKEEQPENRDLLGQAAGTLKGMEQQNGGNQQEEQEKGGGGVQSNLPQEGQGTGKEKQTGGGEGQGERNAELNKDMQQGKSAPGDSTEQGKDKTRQNQGEGRGNQPDPTKRDANKPGAKQDEATGNKTQTGSDEKVGKSKQSEEIPQGAPPAQRYYQPGEQGREGIKGAGYVTVQLPEEVVADSKGGIIGTQESKERKSRPKVPVSNVPLPAHVPDAPTEKQPMPLEYRDLIR
jgi:hypothetical protein